MKSSDETSRGFCVFFTGLSGSGKTTLATALAAALSARGRTITLLDGDVVRAHLSSELGFSKAHRDLNVQRIGFVASEVVRHGGIAICAAIAPYESARQNAASLVTQHGAFFLIHVATPLAVCETRDVKGLYAKARAGKLAGFTGVSDPYEPPSAASLTLDTSNLPLEGTLASILALIDTSDAKA